MTRSASCCAATRAAPLRIALHRSPHLPRGRPGLGGRPADPPRGDPGPARQPGHRGDRTRRQPRERAHARASSSSSTCRALPTSRRWSPTARSRRPTRSEEGARAAGRGRPRPARTGRHDHLRQPECAVGVQPARRDRKRAVRARRRLDQHGRRRPVRRERPGRRRGRAIDGRPAGRASRSTAGERSSCSARCPCVRAARRSGALLLMQDVTELRRRDRQIMSKDATIREIHHRVKNNLQTVAALLRLQARRVSVPGGPGGARGVDAPGPVHRARARDAVGVDRRVRRLRRDRRPAAR